MKHYVAADLHMDMARILSTGHSVGPLTWATIALLTLFGAVDGAAHLTKYKYGETFSALIWWAEKRIPALKLVVAAACVLLGVHLVFRVP